MSDPTIPRKQKAQSGWKNRRRLPHLLILGAMLIGYLLLAHLASNDSKERKSSNALAFEESPDLWLKNPKDVSEFHKALNAGTLSSVAVSRNTARSNEGALLMYTLKDGKKMSSIVPGCISASCTGTVLDNLSERSADKGFTLVRIDIDWRPKTQVLLDELTGAFVWTASIFFVVFAFSAISRMQSNLDGSDATSLDKRPDVKFDDVVGAEDAKAALQRVAAFLKSPQDYLKMGARAPHGVLIKGPPGTGKTLLAKAMAGECKANFIAVDGSYFTSMFYGMGVLKVRNLFKLARKNAPCILFIDEVDGLNSRGEGPANAGSAEMNRIINRVLVEMDGFSQDEGVIVIGATNHEQNIDPAMRRAGRFDYLVEVGLPTVIEREKLFAMYMGKVQGSPSIDHAALARMTSGMSPADIANAVNKAASTAAETGASFVEHEHLLRAIESFQMGGEVSAVKNILTEETRNRLAWHEAGHALVGHLTQAGKVERVTIEPRGSALGVTYITRASEEPLYAQDELTSRLAMMLAGREAELTMFGQVSTGASDDLKRASELAVNMVTTLGFSESFGLLSVAGVPKELVGPDTQQAALLEARKMLEAAQATCRRIFEAHRDQLQALAQALLAKEVLAGDELMQLLSAPSSSPLRTA